MYIRQNVEACGNFNLICFNCRDFSGYFTLGPGSGEIGKNHDISKKMGIFNSLFDILTQMYIN
jgi:hypothetical protein